MWVYDPNQPGADNVAIVVDLADPTRPVRASMISPPGPACPVLCFFAVSYAPRIAARSDRRDRALPALIGHDASMPCRRTTPPTPGAGRRR